MASTDTLSTRSSTARRGAERQLWRGLEAIHAVVHFADETAAVFTELGLHGFWMSDLGTIADSVARRGAVPYPKATGVRRPSPPAAAVPDRARGC